MNQSRREAQLLLVKIMTALIVLVTIFVIVVSLFSDTSIPMTLLILSPMFFSVIGMFQLSKGE
ncbi:hypothetical protein [Amphibacillus indicireducens]|uniref:Uncharacterized protein n=1 Tax=Amphibacillus indicireducens TaxID=1076330 RepID=A0ABP7VTK3_9BACI